MYRIAASFIFFTRLPLWRLVKVPKEYYSRVVEFWPLTGWLTGGVAAGVLWLGAQCFPPVVAVTLAFTARLLLTGALHEDGLADFFDGFGGGGTRERVLEIMKDSRIGTYGVLGLIMYGLLLVGTLSSFPTWLACVSILAADPWSKWCTSQIINVLPYARDEATSKSHTVYVRMSTFAWLASLAIAVLPCFWWMCTLARIPMIAMGVTMLVTAFMLLLVHKRIGGYTGDCCGAIALIGELSYYMSIAASQMLLWK